jgi:hypothetical protein
MLKVEKLLEELCVTLLEKFEGGLCKFIKKASGNGETTLVNETD